MAKIENTKMTVSLDNDSKRIIRDLTKAIDRLSRNAMPFKVQDGVTRLTEPADDPALSDDNENHSQEERPKYARGGYVSANTMPEPDRGCYIPGTLVELDANAVNAFRASVGKYNALR